MSGERIRCFVALDLPGAFRDEATRVQAALRERDLFHGRYTARTNIHLTLKFLGELTPGQVKQAAVVLRGIRFPVCEVRLGGAGMFAPRIIWLELVGADFFQARVDSELAAWFEPEARFMGHLTIARIKSARDPVALASAVEGLEIAPLTGPANSCSLFRSVLNPEGPRYELLERFEFCHD